jgi:serine/threonine protein kinase
MVSPVAALDAYHYASPEIFLAYEDRDTDQHDYYCKRVAMDSRSLGWFFNLKNSNRDPLSIQAQDFRKPHPANDMWALGILLYQLYYSQKVLNWLDPEVTENIKNDPLISRLLEVDRSKRCTAEEGLQILNEMSAVAAPAARRN